MAVAPNDARCLFEYNAVHNTDVAKRRALGAHEGGEIKVAAGHTILAAVGHLLDPAALARGTIMMHMVEYVVFEGVFLDNGLDTCHPRWHVRLPALSKLFADLLTAGLSSARADSIDDYKVRIQDSLKLLQDVDRTITLASVIVDGTATNTWWDYVSPRRLKAGDASNAVFVQMRTMVTGHWYTGAHNNSPFSVALDLMVPTAYVNRTPQVQATAVVAHLRQTAVRPELSHYISTFDAEDEMGRRVADTEEGSFIPLFQKVWKKAYPELVHMVPACNTAAEVVLIIKGLLTRMHLPTTFTDASVSAFCKTIKPHLPNIQHGLAAAADQDERIELLMASVGTSAAMQGSTKSSADGSSSKDPEQWVKVYKQASFQALNSFLEANQTLPLDHRKITAGMWKAAHVSGWMQLNGTAIPQPAFKAVWGLSAHKGISALHECVNAALARNTDGSALPNAGTPVSEKIAKFTVAGNVANGTGKNELDWWGEIVQPIVAKRDGIDALGGVTTTAVEDFFIDIRKLELSVEILTNWFAMFGYAGTGSGSVNTPIRNILRETKTLTHMRNTEMRKPGLVHNFKEAANGIFKEFAASLRAMLAGPVSAAERSDKVLNSGTPAAAAWTAAIEDIRRVVEEHKLEDAGIGRLQKYQRLDNSGSDTASTSTLSLADIGQRKIGGRGAGSQVSTIAPADSASNAGTSSKSAVTRGWGDMAAAYGVYFTGDTLAFGNIVVTYAVEIKIPKDGCLAPYAPDASKNKRNSWCTRPHLCKNSDHARAAGLTEDDISTERTEGGKIDDAWTALSQPTKKTLGNPGGGRGRGGKGRGGKGKGGKGKGGRFQRQQ